MRIEFGRQGIFLPDLDLWLDPTEACRKAWLSHAHCDSAAHGVAYATPETAELHKIRHAGKALPAEFHLAPYGQSWELAGARLTAYPSAHILGAAQLLIEWRGRRILYTGHVKLRPPLCGRQTETVTADHLIIEATYGLPIFHFLSREEARRRMVDFARACLEEGIAPVFQAAELGCGQEVVHVLAEAGVPTAVHPHLARFLPFYAGAGFPAPGWSLYEGDLPPAHALVLTTRSRSLASLRGRRVRVAYVSGWARLDSARTRAGAEELIPYSSHADFQELMDLVRISGAREVDVVDGYTEAFARILSNEGWLARAGARQIRAEGNG